MPWGRAADAPRTGAGTVGTDSTHGTLPAPDPDTSPRRCSAWPSSPCWA